MTTARNKILILFAHPLYEKSRVHKALLHQAATVPGVHIHDLYETYPVFNIDIHYEQRLLKKHDIIIWQHPVYWYSVPPLLKQWIDMVLEFGWAYGKEAQAIAGKYLLQVFSSGGSSDAYSKSGRNKRSLREYMCGHEQTASLCKMIYLPPYVIHGTHKLTDYELAIIANEYEKLLIQLSNTDLASERFEAFTYINDWLHKKTK